MAKVATLGEIRASWTLVDLSQCHLALDLQEDLERELARQRRV